MKGPQIGVLCLQRWRRDGAGPAASSCGCIGPHTRRGCAVPALRQAAATTAGAGCRCCCESAAGGGACSCVAARQPCATVRWRRGGKGCPLQLLWRRGGRPLLKLAGLGVWAAAAAEPGLRPWSTPADPTKESQSGWGEVHVTPGAGATANCRRGSWAAGFSIPTGVSDLNCGAQRWAGQAV